MSSGLSGKRMLGAESVLDQVGTFWVVLYPVTTDAYLEDIMFEANVFDMILQFKGGLTGEEIYGLFNNQREAKKIAVELLLDN